MIGGASRRQSSFWVAARSTAQMAQNGKNRRAIFTILRDRRIEVFLSC